MKNTPRSDTPQEGSQQQQQPVERALTPPIILEENRYYSSNFERTMSQEPQYGLRSGRNHHANLNEEVNELLGEDLKAFNLEEVQCDALDDLINQHLELNILDCDIPEKH